MKKLLIACLALSASACYDPETWSLFYYPDYNDIPGDEQGYQYLAARFESYEQCQQAGIEKVKTGSNNGAYECGEICSINTQHDILVCKTKRR